MKKTKPKNMLKRKKNEGLVAYFERWAEQSGANSVVVQPSKWGGNMCFVKDLSANERGV